MEIRTPLEMFYERESGHPNEIYLCQPLNNKYMEYTWKEVGNYSRRVASYLKELDLPKGSKIGILSKNCAHWVMTDLAIMMSGHVAVPLFPNLSADSLGQIIEHSEMRVLFVGKLDDFASQKEAIPQDLICISFPFYGPKGYVDWEKVISESKALKDKVIRDAGELALIMYTSGTTGQHKGVMQSLYNLGFAGEQYAKLWGLKPGDRLFSHLPMCHAAEKILIEMHSFYTGASLTFVESMDTFLKNLKDTQPTIFGTVPRLWLNLQQGILEKMPQHVLDPLLGFPLISSLVKALIKKKLGLDKAKLFISGAAAMPVSLLRWYKKLGIEIREVYAMTENACYSHLNQSQPCEFGSVGTALPDCEAKLSENGEVLVRHEAMMLGYYKEPKLSFYSFTKDGYLRTGDKGVIDEKGRLKIIGRIKDEFKTSKGKYISPSTIESLLADNPLIEQVCVVGSGMPQPMALAVLFDHAYEGRNEKIEGKLTSILDRVNATLNPYERMWKMVVMSTPWTVDNGYLTPTMKIRRQKVEETYASNFEAWSEKESEVIWA